MIINGFFPWRRHKIFEAISNERARQDAKFGWPNRGLASVNDWKKLAILMEEVGEVSNALLERAVGDDTTQHVRQELLQVAAVCVAWLEWEIEYNDIDYMLADDDAFFGMVA